MELGTKFQNTCQEVTDLYCNIVKIGDQYVNAMTKDIDELVKSASENVENMTTESIRQLSLKLAMESFSFSEVKEKAALKAELSETLRKQTYSRAYVDAEGTGQVKDNKANIAITDAMLSEKLYNYVADQLKIKIDEAHRVIDALKSVMISRASEAKLSGMEGTF